MKTLSDNRNELFGRQEAVFELESDSNPSYDDVRKKISEIKKKPEDNIDVFSVKGRFGSKNFVINAFVYDSADKKNEMVELKKTKKKRKKEEEEKRGKEKRGGRRKGGRKEGKKGRKGEKRKKRKREKREKEKGRKKE